MEIDFLGLNSPRCELEQEKSKNTYIDAGVEISLSLSTSSSLNFSERKKSEFAEKIISSSSNGSPIFTLEKAEQLPSTLFLVAPRLFRHSSSAVSGGGGGGFLYDLNDPAATANLRNISQLSTDQPASLTMLCPTCPDVFTEPEKADQVYISGNASKGGYTPTVAMARRATLARFLEKRLHRMKQAKASHIMGKSNNSEISETKKNNHLKRRS